MLVSNSSSESKPLPPYAGVHVDLSLVACAPILAAVWVGESWRESPGAFISSLLLAPLAIVPVVLGIADTPLSLVADTVTLPTPMVGELDTTVLRPECAIGLASAPPPNKRLQLTAAGGGVRRPWPAAVGSG